MTRFTVQNAYHYTKACGRCLYSVPLRMSSSGRNYASSSRSGGKDDSFRRTWDKEEYERKAKQRIIDEQLDDDELSKPEAPVKRELLKAREFTVNLQAKLNKSVVITKTTPLSEQGGYYCDVCDCVVKDSVNYLDHINGKKHQRNLGMSMKIERSTLDQVKKRLEMNKRKREEQQKSKDYDLDARLKTIEDEEEMSREARRKARLDRKQKGADSLREYEDDGVAAAMGFGGFGSSKR